MDLKKIKELIKIVEETGINSISIEEGAAKVEIKKQSESSHSFSVPAAAPVVTAPVASAAVEPSVSEKTAESAGLTAVNSPMTGTFYAKASPDSPPYVKVGDKITKGQVVCIVEAMKTFNEIEAEVSGVVEKILVNDQDPVDSEQPLLLVRE